jgi:hypothetical protein
MPMRVLLDAGVFIHSEFAKVAVREFPKLPVRLKKDGAALRIYGLKRKQPDENEEYRKQKEALFTVGRMIRQEKIIAYTSTEIEFERFRGSAEIQEFNALRGCKVQKCEPPLERSRFRTTANFVGFMAKGGKKDRASGHPGGPETQIAFLEWLCTLDKASVKVLIQHASIIGLSQFEIESLERLDWFQFICKRSGSPENYVDVFHLWTAERHGMHSLLTLERRLPRIIESIRNEREKRIHINAEAVRPLDLLQTLGISEPDPVPINTDQFYNLYER